MRAFSIIYFFISLIGFGFVNINAQTTVTDNELDKKYTPNATSIFNRLAKKGGGGGNQYKEDVTFLNCIRFSPTLLIRQKVGLFYERKIVDGLSVNVGIAKAFGPDVFQNLAYDINLSSLLIDSKILSPSDIIQYSNYFSSSLLITGSARFYFSGTAFDGSAVEFMFRRETMRYLLEPSKTGSRLIDGENLASFSMSQFAFGYCFSGVSGKNNNIVNEFFFNFGMKLFTYTQFEEQLVGNKTYIRATGLTNTFRVLPSINIGYSFGFGF